MNENATLYKKLAAVMGGISRVPKNGINQHFRYRFAQDSDVLDVVRGLLAEQNVAVFVSMTDLVQDGKITRASFDYTLACGDTGATITTRWTGEAADSQDKGINKAATAALKYWLLKTFLISTGDEDPDAGPAPRRHAEPEPPAPEPPPPPEHWAFNGGGKRMAARINELGLTWAQIADKLEPGRNLSRISETSLTEAEFAQRLTTLAAPPPEPPPPADQPPPEAPDPAPEPPAKKPRPAYGAPPAPIPPGAASH